jgi:mannose-6-phosphate isomerase-like protein (cupin superfamily)
VGRKEVAVPVFDLTTGWVNPSNRPPWSAVPAGGARFDRHYHRTDEIWLIGSGKAKVLSDGVEQYVQGGDVVLTRAGDSHDFVEVYEEVKGYFVEMGPPVDGQAGHLHRGAADAQGHAVPLRPVPADFPVRPATGPAALSASSSTAAGEAPHQPGATNR